MRVCMGVWWEQAKWEISVAVGTQIDGMERRALIDFDTCPRVPLRIVCVVCALVITRLECGRVVSKCRYKGKQCHLLVICTVV